MKTGTLIFIVALITRAALAAAVPTITGVAPNSGTINGGTTVIISGSNFNNGPATAVTFGVSAATFTLIDDATISAVVPAHAVGNVTISVTNGAGTGTSTLANGYTYTTTNVNLQVTVTLTIPQRADIQWGAGTSADDTGSARQLTILPFTWNVKDPEFGAANQVNPGATYFSNDATNNKAFVISNVSPTNATNTITAITTDTANWTAGAAPAANVFEIQASMNGAPYQALSSSGSVVTLTNSLVKGTDQSLILQFSSPTLISVAAVGTTQTLTMTLISTAN